MEEWRDIKGLEGEYQVSNHGRIKSLHRTMMRSNGRRQEFRERILKSPCDENGYPQVRAGGTTRKVHRIVALTFLGDRPKGAVIRHLDGNPLNNHISNLKYGTESENVLDGYSYRGIIRFDQKLNPRKALEIIDELKRGERSVDLSRRYGVTQATICDIKFKRIYAWLQ